MSRSAAGAASSPTPSRLRKLRIGNAQLAKVPQVPDDVALGREPVVELPEGSAVVDTGDRVRDRLSQYRILVLRERNRFPLLK